MNNLIEVAAVCPSCKKQFTYASNQRNYSFAFNCNYCHKSFTSQIAKVRSKNCRSNKKNQDKIYSLRIIRNDSSEDLVQFTTSYDTNVEARQGDIIMLTYLNNQLHIVQNFTINNYYVVARSGGCLGTAVFIGIVVLLFMLL